MSLESAIGYAAAQIANAKDPEAKEAARQRYWRLVIARSSIREQMRGLPSSYQSEIADGMVPKRKG